MSRYATVKWFARHMERKLRQNSSKGGWDDCDFEYLVRRLREEIAELENAVSYYNGGAGKHTIVDEAADVANFAMMIADVARRPV